MYIWETACCMFLLSGFLAEALRVSTGQQAPLELLALGSGTGPSISNAMINAPHIFNTINGAMRQWGPSLKHNGMSFFPVTIAENTIFYHGNVSNIPLDDVAWLAFEVEHAEIFLGDSPLFPGANFSYPHRKREIEKPNYSHLSTYRITQPLKNVLYLDGQSAAKSTLGTLDTQDKLLLKDSRFKEYPGFQDFNRVSSICGLSPHLDGIVRMELGFELILCNARKTSQLIRTSTRPKMWTKERTSEDTFWNGEMLRGISLGYSGVGAGKVLIDYSSMVSAYFYPLNLTNPIAERAQLPRIPTGDVEGVERLRKDVLAIFDGRERVQGKIDWQAITDSIVSRYSDRLAYMKSSKSNRTEMLFEINFLLERFIDHSEKNLTVAQELCTAEYLLPVEPRPTSLTEEMIYEAFTVVSGKICSVLLEAREKLMERDDSDVAAEVKQLIEGLMKWLDWSTWLECGKCDWNEVCVVAIWPWGSKEDHEHPRCYEITVAWGGTGYWDFYF